MPAHSASAAQARATAPSATHTAPAAAGGGITRAAPRQTSTARATAKPAEPAKGVSASSEGKSPQAGSARSGSQGARLKTWPPG